MPEKRRGALRRERAAQSVLDADLQAPGTAAEARDLQSRDSLLASNKAVHAELQRYGIQHSSEVHDGNRITQRFRSNCFHFLQISSQPSDRSAAPLVDRWTAGTSPSPNPLLLPLPCLLKPVTNEAIDCRVLILATREGDVWASALKFAQSLVFARKYARVKTG